MSLICPVLVCRCEWGFPMCGCTAPSQLKSVCYVFISYLYSLTSAQFGRRLPNIQATEKGKEHILILSSFLLILSKSINPLKKKEIKNGYKSAPCCGNPGPNKGSVQFRRSWGNVLVLAPSETTSVQCTVWEEQSLCLTEEYFS